MPKIELYAPTALEVKLASYHAKGLTAEEISLKMKISKRMVEKHTLQLCSKMKAKNKTHLVAMMIDRKLISLKK